MMDSAKGFVKMEKLTVPLQDTECDRYKRMFEAACVALGEIDDALGCDPNDGGSEPIIDALYELKEGLEIIDNMIKNINMHGQYSQESTLLFLSQARQCLKSLDNLPSI